MPILLSIVDEFLEPLDEKMPSCVYKVKHIATGRIFVAKRVASIKKGDTTIPIQLEIGQKVTSRYLVQVVDTFVNLLDQFIVMEYFKDGDMRQLISKMKESGKKLSEYVLTLLLSV
jgi:serine/threonine protein kinase